MHAFLLKTEDFFRNPFLQLVVGLVLMTTALAEAGDSIYDDLTTGDIGAHHGISLLGLVHALRSVPAIIGSLILFAEADKEHEAEKKRESETEGE